MKKPNWKIILKCAPVTIAVSLAPLLDIIASFLERLEKFVGSNITFLQLARGIILLAMIIALKPSPYLIKKTKVIKPILIMCLYLIVGSFIFQFPFLCILQVFKIFFLCIVFLSTYKFAKKGWIDERWLKGVSWSILLTIIISQIIGFKMGIMNIEYHTEFSLVGITGQPSEIGAYLASIFPIFFLGSTLFLQNIAGILIILLSSIGTLRRSSFIAIFLAMIIAFSLKFKQAIRFKGANKVLILMVFVLSIICICFVLKYSGLGQDFVKRMDSLDIRKGGTGSGRTIFMLITINYILNRDIIDFVFGEGYGIINLVLHRDFGVAIGSHNDWLDITVAMGMIGFLLYLWYFVEVMRLCLDLRNSRYRDAIFSAFVIIMFFSIATGGFNPGFISIFALLGMLEYKNKFLKVIKLQKQRDSKLISDF